MKYFESRLHHNIFTLISILGIVTSASQVYSQTFQTYYEEANKLQNQRNYQEAIVYLDSAMSKKSNVDSCYALKAFCLLSMGDCYNAISNCDTAINLNKEKAFAYFIRGVSMKEFIYRARYDDKIVDMNKEADSIKYANGRASAWNDFTKAIMLDSNYADAYSNRAYLFMEVGNFEMALIDFNKAIELEPSNSSFYADRAIYYLQTKNGNKALPDINNAILLDSTNAYYFDVRSTIKHNLLNDCKGACEDLERAHKMGFKGEKSYKECDGKK
jgi:tetratricopeptide (TPR) repeat protein